MYQHAGINKKTNQVNPVNNFFGTSKVSTAPVFIQPKLTINDPGDEYEKEADEMADKVMRMQQPFVQAKPLLVSPVQRKCAHCEEDEKKAQRKEMNSSETTADHTLESYVGNLNGSGQSLPGQVRSFYEPRFGYDFSNVKVHNDSVAAKSAQAINALAYTSRNNIVFNSGQYSPNTNSGKRLLGHELTHVVQQSNSIQSKKIQRTIGDGHDLNAARFSGNVILEAVYDGERLLKNGSKGAAVGILQQALLDAGMTLPVHGVDNDFGPETKAAVEAFQRASGLSVAGVDGIVGSTTMGWLDQLFSTATTPAGTTPGATTGCPAFKTVSIDLVSLDGSNRNPVEDLKFLNSVFNQACVKFVLTGGGSIDNATTTSLLGGDTDLDTAPACGAFSAEENAMRIGATSMLGLTGKIKVFYVQSMTPANNGVSAPPFCATGVAAPFMFHTYISNSANQRTLAHEMGHQLLNCECHGQVDPNNLMVPNSPGSNLEPAQEATIFTNA